jgi:hypothetical protein
MVEQANVIYTSILETWIHTNTNLQQVAIACSCSCSCSKTYPNFYRIVVHQECGYKTCSAHKESTDSLEKVGSNWGFVILAIT